jgi:hypothetical protein
VAQLTLFPSSRSGSSLATALRRELRAFSDFGKATVVTSTRAAGSSGEVQVETFTNEFWTNKQRAASSLHEVSYRACFKPQLPRFFVERLTRPGDLVYDPYMGRGTTVLEAALLGRRAAGCDVNPLSRTLLEPRLSPPTPGAVDDRLEEIALDARRGVLPENADDLRVFFHEETLGEICALRAYLLERDKTHQLDAIDLWIRLVAINRLTGHSPGFFSVYTLPPNQAVSVESQRRINARLGQSPPRRSVRALISKKTRSLLADVDTRARRTLARRSRDALLLTRPAASTPELAADSVALVVTSPPFLDVVDYALDNWLRCWFAGIDAGAVELTSPARLDDWAAAQTAVFRELARILRPGGFVAFEVGEIRGGRLKLEETAIACGLAAGLVPVLVLLNDQRFTKTANCWGVSNGRKGTNTNRVVLLAKPGP